MKRLLQVCLLSFLLLNMGCRSLKKAMFVMPAAALNPRLPDLEVTVDANPLLSSEGASPEDARKLFELELKRNLMDAPDTAKYGFIKLQITNSTLQRTGRGLHAFQMATLMTPTILGIPLEYYRTSLQAEVQVVDVKGNVLATYTGKGASKVRVAMYHGYSQKGAPVLSDVAALRLALNEIRPQLAADAAALRQQLILAKTATEVTIGELPGSVLDAPADSAATPAPAGTTTP